MTHTTRIALLYIIVIVRSPRPKSITPVWGRSVINGAIDETHIVHSPVIIRIIILPGFEHKGGLSCHPFLPKYFRPEVDHTTLSKQCSSPQASNKICLKPEFVQIFFPSHSSENLIHVIILKRTPQCTCSNYKLNKSSK